MIARIILLLTTIVGSAVLTVGQTSHISNYAMKFDTWMTEHGFNFTEHEFLKRLETFIDNDKFIEFVNSKNLSYTLGHNKFSHLSNDEFRELNLCGSLKEPTNLRGVSTVIDYTQTDVDALPASIDWREHNAVTPVKDQGQCGSCWAFSAIGNVENVYSIKTGKLTEFSEQELVDCDRYDHGCNGGLMDNAFKWIQKNGGICTEDEYSYTSGDTKKAGSCQTSCKSVQGTAVESWVDVKPNDANALMMALSKQSVSVAIEADEKAFQLYKSGVFSASCGANLDHGVLAIGYKSTGSEPYWIVKNSWGTGWGDNGYIYLAMSVSASEGQCGILSMASYVTL